MCARPDHIFLDLGFLCKESQACLKAAVLWLLNLGSFDHTARIYTRRRTSPRPEINHICTDNELKIPTEVSGFGVNAPRSPLATEGA